MLCCRRAAIDMLASYCSGLSSEGSIACNIGSHRQELLYYIGHSRPMRTTLSWQSCRSGNGKLPFGLAFLPRNASVLYCLFARDLRSTTTEETVSCVKKDTDVAVSSLLSDWLPIGGVKTAIFVRDFRISIPSATFFFPSDSRLAPHGPCRLVPHCLFPTSIHNFQRPGKT